MNPLKTEEIRVNTIINGVFKMAGEEINPAPVPWGLCDPSPL
jgi:hypothetical protein